MINYRKPIILGGLYLKGSKIPKYLKEIKKVSNFAYEDAKKYQDEKLKKLLFYTWKNVPYYRKILTEVGVIEKGKVKLENFNKIPFLTKDILRKEGKRLLSTEKRRGFYENHSGGSMGEPVRFFQDQNYSDWNIASKIYYRTIIGQNIGEKELRFWGSPRDLSRAKNFLKIRLRNWVFNRVEFDAFGMSEQDMFEYAKKWNEYCPTWVESYADSIYEFAKFIEQENISIKSPKNGILTAGGNLYPEMKKTIERVFNCSVYNRYGSREVGDIAYGKNKLHISFWNQKVEIIKNQIYVTNLNNYSQPFIRYKIGDMAKRGKDEFEIESIIGREFSVFKTSKGKIISGLFFVHFIGSTCNQGGMKKFQVIQKDYDYILFKVVLGDKDSFESNKPKIEKEIQREMGSDCKIEWQFVDQIKPTKDGKYLYTIREVN